MILWSAGLQLTHHQVKPAGMVFNDNTWHTVTVSRATSKVGPAQKFTLSIVCIF